MAGAAATSILVVDDHPVFRAGVVAVLSRLEGDPQVREAGSVAEAWAALEAAPPTCATLDLQLGEANGFTLLVKARARGLPTRFVVVSLFDDEALRARAMALGASGFVSKDHGLDQLADAVRAVLRLPLPPARVDDVGPAPSLDERLPPLGALTRLSPAERLVLRELSHNRTSTEIAARLGVSPRTVQNHRAHICDKLGLRGTHRLLAVALGLRDVLDHDER